MSISTVGYSDPEKTYKKPFHGRNDSAELDVFEASRYFSVGNEAFTHKVMREDKQALREGRISLDMPMRNVNALPTQSHGLEKQMMKEKKHKQPSSPGGRLASFLNSLFNQTSSKKKKSKSCTTQSMKDEEESPGGRRKRRSSISHFRSSNTTTADSKASMYSSSTSGFRTPPPYSQTPTKSLYKDLRSYSDHKQVMVPNLSKYNGQVKSSTAFPSEALDSKSNTDMDWLDENFKFSTNGVSDKYHKYSNKELSRKDRIWEDQYPPEEKEFRKFINELDDGADSDSSSDLFELQNYDLGDHYSSGLPVYETTHMDSFKRGAVRISNGKL